MTMTTYKIIRFHYWPEPGQPIMQTGLTLDEAKAHCADPESSSKTCTLPELIAYTEREGPWFDGFTAEED